MNLFQAIKTGKPFARPGKEYFYTEEDLLAEDWEVKAPTVTLTKEAFLKAYDDAILRDLHKLTTGTPRLFLLLQELGLE